VTEKGKKKGGKKKRGGGGKGENTGGRCPGSFTKRISATVGKRRGGGTQRLTTTFLYLLEISVANGRGRDVGRPAFLLIPTYVLNPDFGWGGREERKREGMTPSTDLLFRRRQQEKRGKGGEKANRSRSPSIFLPRGGDAVAVLG